jgi:hypothetical protein
VTYGDKEEDMTRRLTAAWRTILVGVVLAMLGGGAARAGDEAVKIRFLACVDFLTPLAFPPCISREFNGDTIETTGSGVFEIEPNGEGDVKGGGNFIHRGPAGNVIARGSWRAKKFLAYRTYGCAGCPAGLPPGSEGGNLLITAELRPDGGGEVDATIEINCALGNTPPNRLYDGVEVRVLGVRFDQAQDGATLFIR